MLAAASKPGAAESSPRRSLPLESGEFMHSRDFLRRYEPMPHVKKAELIEGVVYRGSPEWFCLEDDDYRPQLPDAQGELHSRVFPGLQLPVAPLLAGDTAKVLAALTGHEPLNREPPESSVNSEDTCSQAHSTILAKFGHRECFIPVGSQRGHCRAFFWDTFQWN